jgi:hypothetical protein
LQEHVCLYLIQDHPSSMMVNYTRFADLIGRYPEYALYRKFAALNAKRLLFMQAELSHLEYDLALIAEHDQSDPQTASFATSWNKMSNAPPGGQADLQSQKVREISEKLDKYCW